MSFLSVLRTTLQHADVRQDSLSWGKQCLRIAQAWALCLLLSLTIGGLISWLLPDLMSTHHLIQDFLKDSSIRYALTVIALMGPVMEELMFRSFLVSTRWSLAMTSGVWTIWLLDRVMGWFVPSTNPVQGSIGSLLRQVLFVVGTVGIWYLLLRGAWAKRLMNTLHHHRYLLLGLSSFLFGWIHITNFADSGVWSKIIILTLPQTLIGLVLGVIRIRGKLRHSIVVHCVYNFTLISPIVGLTLAGIPMREVSDDAQLTTLIEHLDPLQYLLLSVLMLGIVLIVIAVVIINIYTIGEFLNDVSLSKQKE